MVHAGWIFILKMVNALICVPEGITSKVALVSVVKKAALNVGKQTNVSNAMTHSFSKKHLARHPVPPGTPLLLVINVCLVELAVTHVPVRHNRDCFLTNLS